MSNGDGLVTIAGRAVFVHGFQRAAAASGLLFYLRPVVADFSAQV
jgi:hypothetical protein